MKRRISVGMANGVVVVALLAGGSSFVYAKGPKGGSSDIGAIHAIGTIYTTLPRFDRGGGGAGVQGASFSPAAAAQVPGGASAGAPSVGQGGSRDESSRSKSDKSVEIVDSKSRASRKESGKDNANGEASAQSEAAAATQSAETAAPKPTRLPSCT